MRRTDGFFRNGRTSCHPVPGERLADIARCTLCHLGSQPGTPLPNPHQHNGLCDEELKPDDGQRHPDDPSRHASREPTIDGNTVPVPITLHHELLARHLLRKRHCDGSRLRCPPC